MKRFVLLLIVLIGALTAQADSFPYLTFETTEGAKASIPIGNSEEGNVKSVEIAINGNTLTVGDQQFTLTNLAKMYFSTTDETAAGIGEELSVKSEEIIEIYDLQGKKVKSEVGRVKREDLPKGIYIVKTKEKTYKLMVR